MLVDVVEECNREMFCIGNNSRSLLVSLEDVAGSIQEFRCDLSHGPGRCPSSEAHRLVRIGIKDKEGLRDLGGLRIIILSMPAHLPFAVAAHAMGIDGQEVAAEMPGSASEQSQRDLKLLRFIDGVSPQELMNGHIGDHKRQSIEQFKAFLAQGALLA